MPSPLITTDATPRTMLILTPRPSLTTSPAVFALLAITDLVIAAQADDGTSAVFVIAGAAKRVGSSVSVLGTTSVQKFGDAGASAWAAALVASGGALTVQVTGAVSTRITWMLDRAGLYSGFRGGFDWLGVE